jgi:hypothetical protein
LSGRAPAERSWLEVQWRKVRNPPPPVFRAVASNVIVAAIGGALLFLYGRATPGADIAPLIALYVLIVVAAGSLATYFWVKLPTGASGVRRRSAWAGVLGFFSSLPVAYLALVIVFQILPT